MDGENQKLSVAEASRRGGKHRHSGGVGVDMSIPLRPALRESITPFTPGTEYKVRHTVRAMGMFIHEFMLELGQIVGTLRGQPHTRLRKETRILVQLRLNFSSC